MKTTKKIFAAFLAVMMLALMIPFSASAADYEVSITGHKDFTFALYKVADYNTTEGFTNVAGNADVKAVLANATSGTYDSAALLAACDASTFTSSVATFTDKYEASVAAGVYYVKATKLPATYTAVGNSVFAVPYVNANGEVVTEVELNAGTKCANGEVKFDKYFTNYKNESYISAALNDVVNYTIEASVIGSKDAKLKSYEINDVMSAGLTFNNDVAVTLTGGKNGAADWTLDKGTYYTAAANGTDNNFDVKLTSALLNNDAFYNYANVVVTYSATVNNDAVIAGQGNPNDAKLVYMNANNESYEANDDEITVYTFKIDLLKTDAANGKVLEGAKFELYDASGAKVGETLTTNANGVIVFERVKAGETYTLKEVEAPNGYILNSTEYTVTVSYTVANGEATPTISGATVENNVVKITNNRVLVPATGGMGTMMFTICGAALILFAGVLFIVVRRKNTAE